jgi:hypothetical protein
MTTFHTVGSSPSFGAPILTTSQGKAAPPRPAARVTRLRLDSGGAGAAHGQTQGGAMLSGHMSRRWLCRLFAGAGVTILAATPASAQVTETGWGKCPPTPCPAPGYQTMPAWPPASTAPSTTAPSTGAPGTLPPGAEGAPVVSPAAEGSALALSGSNVALAAPGYVDFAVPITQFRLRFDAAYDNNRPDRAEFFYGKCGCFATLPPGNPNRDPHAPGPPLPETRVDYQELRPYFEYAFNNRFSAFVETPYRFINPDQNANENGFGNVLAGFKYALVACPDHYLTFQFTASTPTADVDRGLGNELVGLEPGVLWFRQLTDRLAVNAELRDWIPIGGTDFQGNILRSGTAVSYLVYNGCNFRVTPIGEMVGWVVLSGKELTPGGTRDASGDTIVNGKVGVRFGFGPLVGPANMSRSDLYIGYGRALTGDVWYKDILRVEYALRF